MLMKHRPNTWQVIASVILLGSLGCGKSEQPQARPPEVAVARVEQRDVPISKEWVGTLDGMVNAQIRAQVTGYLLRQNYQEGSFIKKGQLLFEIDPRTSQAALDQAKGQLANTEGQLAQAEANQVKTQLDVNRFVPLAKEQAVSEQDLDNAVQANAAAKAQVRAAHAQIAASKAQVQAAELNLSFAKIVSPIDGIAGIAQVQVGDLVGQTTALTTVSTVDPIKVYFSATEQEYLNYVQENPDAVKRAASEERIELQMILADGTLYPHRGKFLVADREVNLQTGTLRLQGLFPNPGNILRPGQFARVRAITKTIKGALLVPQRAVTELQGSFQVAVVGKDNKVSIRQVKTGERSGSMWIIEAGLKPGERVVAEGTQKVRSDLVVDPKPFVAAAPASAQSQRTAP
jgi:RND family efflux transporter MFP subunit